MGPTVEAVVIAAGAAALVGAAGAVQSQSHKSRANSFGSVKYIEEAIFFIYDTGFG